MITVVYPPGASDPIHRHNAYAFLYVLEGSVVMQLKGGKEVTLTPGHTFYEGPNDIHTVGRNASNTKPAKFIVFLVKDKGAPVLLPVSQRRRAFLLRQNSIQEKSKGTITVRDGTRIYDKDWGEGPVVTFSRGCGGHTGRRPEPLQTLTENLDT